MTLNEQAALTANTLNQPFNHELKERAKDLYKQQMALYIRRSVKEHGLDTTLIVGYNAELIKVDRFDKPINTKPKQTTAIGTEEKEVVDPIEDFVLRTKHRVPAPVRYPGDAPFTYVGTADGRISFPMRHQVEGDIMHLYLFTGGSRSYRISNGYIYINDRPHHPVRLDVLRVEGVFESPDEILTMYNGSDGQDLNLPFPADIIAMIQGNVLQLLGSVPPDDISVKQSDNRIVNEGQ